MGCTYYGRKKIFSKEEVITSENVWDVVSTALSTHNTNANDIDYLYNYFKGKQDIIYRTKEIREDICNKVVINRAAQIVNFKRGYLLTKDIQYIRDGEAGKEQSESIKQLNSYMKSEGKSTKDSVLAEWMYIAGTAYRYVSAKKWLGYEQRDESEAPFEFYTLDPRDCFVAYSREVGNKPVFACIRSVPVDSELAPTEYTVYTYDSIYKLNDYGVIEKSGNPLGYIPVIEYPENNSRLGAFEIVLPILDEINNVMSNEIDDIEQTVQALLILIGVDIDEKDADGNHINSMKAIRARGGIALPDKESDAKYLSLQLASGQTQSALNSLDYAWMEICGIPNRNGGNSTSDTGAATQLRDGWEAAETMASNTQTMWVESERDFLKIVISILKDNGGTDLRAEDIEPHFNRQNAINIQSRVQAFTGLWASGAIDLHDCIMISGIAHDVETVTENGLAWYNEQQEKQERELQEAIKQERNADEEPDKEVKSDE